jgi:arginase
MKIAISNVHLDLGAGRRGTDMGPSAMHVAGLVPRLRELGHEIVDVEALGSSQEQGDPGAPNARFLQVIHRICSRLADRVEANVRNGVFPLVLGGDHSQAIGTISGMARAWRSSGRRLGVFWVDAHTDMNTPDSSPSGNIHGMPLATLLGRGAPELVAIAGEQPALHPEDVVVFGARDVDAAESAVVRDLGVRVYTMSELDQRGTALCAAEALAHVRRFTDGVHLSFDLDGVDPTDAPGVGTPVPGGLSLRESHLLCELLNQSGCVVGMEMVELNPTLDERNRTGQLAVWLILSALGKNILWDPVPK